MNNQAPSLLLFENTLYSVISAGLALQVAERSDHRVRSLGMEIPIPAAIGQFLTLYSSPKPSQIHIIGSKQFCDRISLLLSLKDYDLPSIAHHSPNSAESTKEVLRSIFGSMYSEYLPNTIHGEELGLTESEKALIENFISYGYLQGGIDIALKGLQEGFDERYTTKGIELESLKEEIPPYENLNELDSSSLKLLQLQPVRSLGVRATIRSLQSVASQIALRYQLPIFLPGIFALPEEERELTLVRGWNREAQSLLEFKAFELNDDWVALY